MSAQLLPILALGLLLAGLVAIRRPVRLLQGFCLVSPLGLTYLPGSIQLITVAALAVIGLALWERISSGGLPVPGSVASWSALLWTAGVIVSVAASDDPGRASVFGAWQVVAVWFAVAFAHAAGRPDRLGSVLIPYLIGAAAVGASGLFLLDAPIDSSFGGAVLTGRPVGVFSQPNEYGAYCMLLWVFCLGLTLLTTGWRRFFAAAAAVTCVAGLATSFSRGAWIGAIAGMVLLAVLIPQIRRAQAVLLLWTVGALGLVLVILPFWNIPELLLQRALSIFNPASNPFDSRMALMAEGTRQFGSRPLLGQGPNLFKVVSADHDSLSRTVGGEHPHNVIIATLAEQGLIGFTALLGFVAAVVIAAGSARHTARFASRTRAIRSRQNDIGLGSIVTLCATSALGALMVEGVVDYPIRNALMRTTVWTMVGLVLAGQRVASAGALASTGNTEWSSDPDLRGMTRHG